MKAPKVKKYVQKLGGDTPGGTVVPNPADLQRGYSLPANIPQADPVKLAAEAAATKKAAQAKAAGLNSTVNSLTSAGSTLANLGSLYVNSQNLPDENGKIDSTKSAIAGGLSGLATGASTGASIGSIIPGVGTAIGAGAGALIGGISGLFTGSSDADKQNEEAAKLAEEKKKQDDAAKMAISNAKTQSAIVNRDLEGYSKGGYIKAPKMSNGGGVPVKDRVKLSNSEVIDRAKKGMSVTDYDSTTDLDRGRIKSMENRMASEKSRERTKADRANFALNTIVLGAINKVNPWGKSDEQFDSEKAEQYKHNFGEYPPLQSKRYGGLVQKCASGGLIKGPGTGTSDSIPAQVQGNSFIVPAENKEAGLAVRKIIKAPLVKAKLSGGNTPVALSNNEVLFTPQEVERAKRKGIDLKTLAPDAAMKFKMQ